MKLIYETYISILILAMICAGGYLIKSIYFPEEDYTEYIQLEEGWSAKLDYVEESGVLNLIKTTYYFGNTEYNRLAAESEMTVIVADEFIRVKLETIPSPGNNSGKQCVQAKRLVNDSPIKTTLYCK